ncbi:18166_t:CDS:2, partial [Cetraspora pellucida]
PIASFYLIMKRTYVVTEDVYETYFGEFRTGNDDVTFFGTEIDARPILKLVMILDEKVCEPSIDEICHEHILVRKPGGGGNGNTDEINNLIAIHAKLNGYNGNDNLTSEKEPKENDESNNAHEISEQTENNNTRNSFIKTLEEMLNAKWNDKNGHAQLKFYVNIKLALIIARIISFKETDDQNKAIIKDFLNKYKTESDETAENTNHDNRYNAINKYLEENLETEKENETVFYRAL